MTRLPTGNYASLFLCGGVLLCSILFAVNPRSAPANAAEEDPYTLESAKNFLTDDPPRGADGTFHVVVEIPTGTNQKWEVDKADGKLRWEFKNGAPRVVKYLGYPGNYGMVPRTLLPEEEGGDGDPLDVLVLGPAVARGSVLEARPVGVLRLLDGGETDDKILAIAADSPLAEARDLEQLEERFPGVLTIVETWFTHYKGKGEIESKGFAGPAAAEAMIDRCAASFEAR